MRFLYEKLGSSVGALAYLCAKFVSFAASVAELAHEEKLCTQPIAQSITHSLTHSLKLI